MKTNVQLSARVYELESKKTLKQITASSPRYYAWVSCLWSYIGLRFHPVVRGKITVHVLSAADTPTALPVDQEWERMEFRL